MRLRSVRSRVLVLILLPLLSLTGLYAFVASITAGDAITLARAVSIRNTLDDPTGLRLYLAGLGLLAILVSVIASIWIGRGLVRELGDLRSAALDLADVRLPQVATRLSLGEDIGTAAEVPFPNPGRDEIGEARLEMLDDLELRAAKPEELESLFQADHLTTRFAVEIEDRGLGITEARTAELNAKLADPISRRHAVSRTVWDLPVLGGDAPPGGPFTVGAHNDAAPAATMSARTGTAEPFVPAPQEAGGDLLRVETPHNEDNLVATETGDSGNVQHDTGKPPVPAAVDLTGLDLPRRVRGASLAPQLHRPAEPPCMPDLTLLRRVADGLRRL